MLKSYKNLLLNDIGKSTNNMSLDNSAQKPPNSRAEHADDGADQTDHHAISPAITIDPVPITALPGISAKKKGRPAKGEPVMVRLNDEERATAESLGDGVVAQGIRIALHTAEKIGKANALLLAGIVTKEKK